MSEQISGMRIFVALFFCFLAFVGVVNLFKTTQTDSTRKNTAAEIDRLVTDEIKTNCRVTLAKYSAVTAGMTLQQVNQIMGFSGTESVNSSGYGVSMVMYGWANANGSNMTAMFQNGQLMSKGQLGLQ